jgi:peptidyl-tRNA hydrolase
MEKLVLSAVAGPASSTPTGKSGSRVGSAQELMAVYDKALEAGLVGHLITGRALTEFGRVPSWPLFGIGRDYDDLIDPVTGDLELY